MQRVAAKDVLASVEKRYDGTRFAEVAPCGSDNIPLPS